MFSIAFVKSSAVIIILRVLGGISTGIIFAILPVYTAEVSEKDIRGQLGIIQLILSTLGNVYIYSVGPFISFRALTISVAIFPLLFITSFYFMPETPYYLVKKGKLKSAVKSIKQLSLDGLSDDALASRLREIEEYVHKGVTNSGSLKELFYRSNRKALVINLVLRTVLVLSGLFVLSSYLQKLINDSGSSISPEVTSIIFGVINLPSVLVAAFLVDRVGRRPLFLISSFGCAIALIAVGIYFYLKENGDVSDILWLPTTGICAYVVLAYLGINAIPGVVQGETFSINTKSIASSIIMIYGSGTSFLLLRFFQPLSDELGVYVMFWFFGAVCILGFLFGIFFLPETKGKTFSEIQDILDKRKTENLQLEAVK
ncbi:hypothetical protein FQR65_LT03286 [Abscondita terminalis]|nr:hypothetical protein FQR65_LT03286 [Abscondita terminalis]